MLALPWQILLLTFYHSVVTQRVEVDYSRRHQNTDHWVSGIFFESKNRTSLLLRSDSNSSTDIDTEVHKEWATAKGPLTTIVDDYLKTCSLAIFYEGATSDLALLLSLALNQRGVKLYLLSEETLKQDVTWSRSLCDGYIFLLTEGETLVHHASVNHHRAPPHRPGYKPPFLWNFQAYCIVVLLDPSLLQPDDLVSLYNFRKTENLIILQESGGHILLWTHRLISKDSGIIFIDSWQNGSFRRGANLFPKKFDDFEGMPVRVATFEHAPSVVYTRDEFANLVNRIGVDMEVIHGLSVVKNFTVEFVEVSYTEKWGTKYPNGSWDGLMKEVYDELSDIGVCNVFIDDFRWTEIDFSYPYNFMPGCFVAPSPKPLSNWQSPTLPFSWDTWVSIGISLLAGGPVLYAISALSVSSESKEFRRLSFNYLFILGSMTMRSTSMVPAHMPGRIYVGFVWLFCLIISTAYSANLIAFLSVTQMAAPIDTVDQLLESSLRLGGHSFWKTQFQRSTEQKIRKLGSKIETDVHYLEVFNEVESGEFSFVENKQYLELNRDARFTYGDRSTIRIVRECFVSYNVGLILPRNSPLTENLANDLLRIFESGMMQKWQAEVIKYFRESYAEERAKAIIDTPSISPLNLSHTQGIFYITGIGYLTAIIIFVYEKICRSTKSKR